MGVDELVAKSSRWLMSVVGSPGTSLDDCSLECPGAMRRLDAKSVSCEVGCELPSRLVVVPEQEQE